ncbi:DUF4393 domain-containing protein [Pseudomonas sp. S2_F03]
MGEEAGGDNNVKATIEAVTGLVKAVPVYEDAVQPAAKQIGKSLETIGKAINVALAPVGMLVWGYEKCQEFISTKVADRLKDVPPEDIITPKPNVAGPAIEALRFTGHEESLRDMYANLLATAMDKNTSDGAHPAFVEIIKQLTPDEARLIAYFMEPKPFPLITVRSESKANGGGFDAMKSVSLFGREANLEISNLIPSYLDNLRRLGLIQIPESYSYTGPGVYDELEGSESVVAMKQYIEQVQEERVCRFDRKAVVVTSLGRQFGSVCVNDHQEPPKNPG